MNARGMAALFDVDPKKALDTFDADCVVAADDGALASFEIKLEDIKTTMVSETELGKPGVYLFVDFQIAGI